MSAALVEARGIGRRYETASGPWALREVDLEVGRGEFVAIVGASGSGKSTLLNILGGLDTPTVGRYRFDGEEFGALGDEHRAAVRNRRIGFVFQSFNLLPALSVRENVELPLLYAADGAGLGGRALELIDRVGLAHRTTHRPAELSGGEMQRAAVARALVMRPALVLADEPTGNLDAATGDAILDLLEAVAREGTTIVMVTHDRRASARAAREIRLEGGRIG